MCQEGKIKYDKIMCWKPSLACYIFDILYRPGKSNVSTRPIISCNLCYTESKSLLNLHVSFCRRSVTNPYHFVRSKKQVPVRYVVNASLSFIAQGWTM